MHPFYPQLSPVKKAVGIYQTGFPGPDRFNFGTGKYDAGIIFLEKFVVEGGSFVSYIDFVRHKLKN
jgi:hypothetical protein